MDCFMTVATFRPNTDMSAVLAVVSDEVAQVETLRVAGRIGAVHVSQARGTVFIETFAADPAAATDTIQTLPMAKWWDLDIYPVSAPPQGDRPA